MESTSIQHSPVRWKLASSLLDTSSFSHTPSIYIIAIIIIANIMLLYTRRGERPLSAAQQREMSYSTYIPKQLPMTSLF